MSSIELTSKVRELKELRIMADELAAEITAKEDAIKAEMTARQTNVVTVDIFTVRWTPVTSSRFDSTRFKAEHADLYTAYSKLTTTRRFTVA